MIPRAARGIRRSVHAQRRGQHHAVRTSAYCRRLNVKRVREFEHEKRHSAGWWKWYRSPRQVAKRRRAAAAATRRYNAYVRREKAYFSAHGLVWANYPKCPSPVPALRAKRKAAEKAARQRRHLARVRKDRREQARYNACIKALRASGAISPAKSTKARKSAKSTKAVSGRRTRKC